MRHKHGIVDVLSDVIAILVAAVVLGLWIILPATLIIIHAPWWVSTSIISFVVGRWLALMSKALET